MVATTSVVLSTRALKCLIVLVPSVVVPICFILFYVKHAAAEYTFYGVRQIPTLSKAGSLAPESIVFAYGLHLEAVLLVAVFLMIYHRNIRKIDLLPTTNPVHPTYLCSCSQQCFSGAPNSALWNQILLAFGLLGCLCMSLVGSVSLDVNDSVHTALAAVMFLCFILHMLVSYMTIDLRVGYSAHQMRLHRLCLFACIPINIVATITSNIVFQTCTSFGCRYFYVNVSPILEYLTILSLLLYIYQFTEDSSHMSLSTICHESDQ